MATKTTPKPPAGAKGAKLEEKSPEAKSPPKGADWLEALAKADPDAANEKYTHMTNAQVLAVARYQRSRSGAKAGDDLTAEQGRLLRAAVRTFPALLETSLSPSEKDALVCFESDELDEEQRKRADQKPGLRAKARWLWVIKGMDQAAQIEAGREARKALEGKDTPRSRRRSAAEKDPSGQRMRRLDEKDGRWSESAFEKLATTSEGVVVFALTDRDKGTMQMIGQLPAAPAFYDHIKPAIKKAGLDPERVDLVTISARFGYTNRPVEQAERYRPPLIGLKDSSSRESAKPATKAG